MDNIVDQAAKALRDVIDEERNSTPANEVRTANCPKLPVLIEAFETAKWEPLKADAHVSVCPFCQKTVRFFESRNEKFGIKEEISSGGMNVLDSGEIPKGNKATNGVVIPKHERKTMRTSIGAVLAAAILIMVTLFVVDWTGKSTPSTASDPPDPFANWQQSAQPGKIPEPKPEPMEKVKPPAIVTGTGERDIQLDEALSRAPDLQSYETQSRSISYMASIVAGNEEIWIDRVHQVKNTRRIEQAVTWTDQPGLHLGQMIDANGFLETGNLNPVRNLKTRPMAFVLEGMWPTEYGKTSPLATEMENTDLAGFTKSLQKIVANRLKLDKKIYFPFKADYRFEEASSVKKVAVDLKVSASYMGKFEADFSGHKSNRSDRRLVYLHLRQPMFRVSLVGGSLSEMLASTPENVAAVVKDRRPAYVNSITYGRVVFAAFETSDDSQLLKAALKWKFSKVVTKVSGELKAKYEKAISRANMRVYVHGGKAAPIFDTDVAKGVEKLQKYLNETVEFSPQNLPAVVGFEVRDLRTGELIGKKEVSEYAAFEEPHRSKYRYRITLTKAEIRDDHDSFPAGDGDWRVRVAIPDKGEVLRMNRGLGNGTHVLNHSGGEHTAPAGQFIFLMSAWESDGLLNGNDDDVTKNVRQDIDLAAMASELSKLDPRSSDPAIQKRINEVCRYPFSLTTVSGNRFHFIVDLIPPKN